MKAYDWAGILYKVAKENSICGCCGSIYYGKQDTLVPSPAKGGMGCGNGIGVYLTDKIVGKDTEGRHIDVVHTKNGPITFALKKKI